MIKPTLIRNIALASLGILLPLAVCAAMPKPQDSQAGSVADAARKTREQKTKDQAKPTKVYTNEDLSEIKGSVSIVGQAPDSDSSKPADTNAADKTVTAKAGVNDEGYWRGKFAGARKVLSEDARELDINQREFNLKQQQYYSDPNVALREQNDRKDLNDTQAKIDELKVKVEKDKQAITDLEEELRKAGGDSSWAEDNSQLPVPAQPPADGEPNSPSQAQPPNTPPSSDAQAPSDTPAPSDVQPANR